MSVITVLHKETRERISTNTEVYGFMVKKLVNGLKIQKGQPIFLYVQVYRQEEWNLQVESSLHSDRATLLREKKRPEHCHNTRLKKQTNSTTRRPELNHIPESPSKRTKYSSKHTTKTSPPMKPSRPLSPKQVTRSPLYKAIIDAQPLNLLS